MEYIHACMFYPDSKEGELSVTWELNYKCKIECPICCNYSDSIGGDIIELEAEEKIAIARDIAKNAEKLHIVEVYLTGGEPLEDPSFPYIINVLLEAPLRLYMASTLYPLAKNKKLIGILGHASNRNLVFIHINGFVLGYLTNKKYQEFKKIIKKLVDLGVHFRIGLPVVPSASKLYDVLIKRLSEVSEYFDEISIYPVIPSGRATRYYGLLVNFYKYRDLFYEIVKKVTNTLSINISIDTRRIVVEAKEPKPLGPCLADRILHITPSGAVYPCSWFAKFKCDTVFGFLPDESIGEIVNSKRRQHFVNWLKTRKPPECESCIFRDVCGYGCPIMSLIYKGSINRADPLCPYSKG